MKSLRKPTVRALASRTRRVAGAGIMKRAGARSCIRRMRGMPSQTFIGSIERGLRRPQCFTRGSMTNAQTTKAEKTTTASDIKKVSMALNSERRSASSVRQQARRAEAGGEEREGVRSSAPRRRGRGGSIRGALYRCRKGGRARQRTAASAVAVQGWHWPRRCEKSHARPQKADSREQAKVLQMNAPRDSFAGLATLPPKAHAQKSRHGRLRISWPERQDGCSDHHGREANHRSRRVGRVWSGTPKDSCSQELPALKFV